MSDFINAAVHVANTWADPENPSRATAAQQCLDASDTLTEASLAFALNQFMDQLDAAGMKSWFGGKEANTPIDVGVLVDDPVPTETLRLAFAVWGSGHRFLGRTGEPALPVLQAFDEDLRAQGIDLSLEAMNQEDVVEGADALLAVPTPETLDRVQQHCEEHGFTDALRWIIPPTYSVAVLDGEESEEEREDLAEDLLLYEGAHRRNVSLIWAPREFPPDPYLEAMAQFRGIVPAHPSTPGALEMPKALLEAQETPHAYAEGLQFLVSKGDPAPQPGVHLRWSEYDALGTVLDWICGHAAGLYAVVARSALHDQLNVPVPLCAPGRVHRPDVPDEDDRAVTGFLASL